MRSPAHAPTAHPGLATDAWSVLGAALVAQTAVSVVEQGLPTLTGFIKEDLGVSAAVAGLIVSALGLGKIPGFYPAGSAVDRIGERLVLVVGVLVTALLVVIAALSPLAAFLPLLVLAGVFSATSTPAGGKLVLLAFPPSQRGLAMGIRHTGIPLGGVVAAVLLPWIAESWSWRGSLLVGGAMMAVGALTVLAVAGVGPREERPAARAGSHPPLARDRDLLLVTVWGCLLVSGQYAILAFLALDVREAASLSLATATPLVAVAQAGGIVGRIGFGAASDRLLGGRRKPLVVGLTGLGLAAAVALALLPGRVPLAFLAVAIFVAGISLIGWQGLWMTSVAELAGAARAGSATGFGLTFSAIALTVSPPLYGLVADLAGDFSAVWAVLAGVLALALVPAALLREPHRP